MKMVKKGVKINRLVSLDKNYRFYLLYIKFFNKCCFCNYVISIKT